MTRRMIITIVNNGIQEKWVYDNAHLEHGKWMKGSPATSISADSSVEIKSEKQTGSFYGTTGWISYKSDTNPGSTMTITWNKPYGTDATTCTVDMNSQKYLAKVENKNFQQSEAWCDVVISVNTEPVIDTKTWMGKLADNTSLNNIMMPGSHDAGMSELHHCSVGASDSNTQTQQLDIQGQLEAGSRYFDIRVDYDHDELITYHRTDVVGIGFGCSGQLLATVLDQATTFLAQNNKEVVILKFSHIRGDSQDTMQRIDNMLNESQYKIYVHDGQDINLAALQLSDCRGKLIIVMDYSYNINPSQGRFFFRDGFVASEDYKICEFRGLNMTVCDRYANTDSYDEMAANQIAKWDAYGNFGQDYLFLLSWTLTAGASGSIRDLAKIANDNLPNVLRRQIDEAGKGKPNIVYIDFVNVTTCRAIIAYNFS